MIPFTRITDDWVLYFSMFLFCGNLFRCSPLTHCYSALFETVEPQINKTNIYFTYPVTVSFSTKWKSILVLQSKSLNDYCIIWLFCKYCNPISSENWERGNPTFKSHFKVWTKSQNLRDSTPISGCFSVVIFRRLARIGKRGGEAFLKEWDNCKRSCPNFLCSCIRITRIFRPNSEIRTVFQPKNRWSPKNKKKKGLHRNWDGFFGQNRKFERFFSPKTSDLQKKKSSPELRRIFWPNSQIQTFFQAKSRQLLHSFGTQIP